MGELSVKKPHRGQSLYSGLQGMDRSLLKSPLLSCTEKTVSQLSDLQTRIHKPTKVKSGIPDYQVEEPVLGRPQPLPVQYNSSLNCWDVFPRGNNM